MWLHLPGARVDLDGHVVHQGDGREPLTRLEAGALRYLAAHPGEAVSRDRLEREVWGFGAGVRSEAVPVAMRRLRAKLGAEALVFVRGEGWRLGDPAVDDRPAAASERDAFVGREVELAALTARFASGARVVTLIGTVGTGKSRLARRFVAQAGFPGGVILCELADARSADGACTVLAAALGAGPSPADPVEHLGRILGRRGKALVLLDDIEAIAPIAPALLEVWLAVAPEARFLVTSRAVLGLRGEALFAVEPLPVPSIDAVTAAEVLATDAGRLLAARAQEASPGFALSDADAPSAALLLARLEGLPLAIELATARLRLMPLRELVERTRDRFRLLVAAGRSDRQATLRAAIASSWDLLSPWEAAALGQLSVFEGPFDLAAAEAVIDLGPGAPWTPDVVQSLVDRSLLRRDPRGRLGLYAAIAEFAAERRGDASAAEARHGAWYAAIAVGERVPEPALDNLVAASRRAAVRDVEVAAACAVGAALVLCQRGPVRTAIELADGALALPGVSDGLRRGAMRARAKALHRIGRAVDALAMAEMCLAASREAGDRPDEARSLGMLAMLLRELGRPRDAADSAALAVAVARECGVAGLLASPLQELGSVRAALGDAEGARAAWAEAIRAAREAGDVVTEALAFGNSAIRLRSEGRLDEAASRLRRARDLAMSAGNARAAMAWTGSLGLVDRAAGRFAEARARLEEAVEGAIRIGDRRFEGIWQGQLGTLLVEAAPGQAREHLEQARVVFVEVADGPSIGVVDAHLALLDAREGRPGAVERARAAAERTRASGMRVDASVVLTVQAEVEARAGHREAALALLAEVEAAPDLVRADPIVRAHLASARRCLA